MMQNGHVELKPYPIEDNRFIYIIDDGSKVPIALDVLKQQPEFNYAEIDSEKYGSFFRTPPLLSVSTITAMSSMDHCWHQRRQHRPSRCFFTSQLPTQTSIHSLFPPRTGFQILRTALLLEDPPRRGDEGRVAHQDEGHEGADKDEA
jgi:hypothetical protein